MPHLKNEHSQRSVSISPFNKNRVMQSLTHPFFVEAKLLSIKDFYLKGFRLDLIKVYFQFIKRTAFFKEREINGFEDKF